MPHPPALRVGVLALTGARSSDVEVAARAITSRLYVVVEDLGRAEIPRAFLDPRRGQYVADSVLALAASVARRSAVDAVVAVAGVDAYTPGLNFVFGIASFYARACVVFTPRLYPEFYGEPPNPQLYELRLRKEVLHELGHSLGLQHCANPRCVMRFSNSIVEVDMKSDDYCPRCKEKLASSGVIVKA